MDRYINVLLSNFKSEDDRIFTYKVTDDYKNIELNVGLRVIVPFGPKNNQVEGYVIELDPEITYDKSKIKSIIRIPDRYIYFDNEMLSLAKFIQDKYCCGLNEAINTFVPQSVRNIKKKEEIVTYISLSDNFMNLSLDEKNETINKLKNNKAKLNQGLILEYIFNEAKNNDNDNDNNNDNNNDNDISSYKVILNDILNKFNVTRSTIDTMKKNNFIITFNDYLIDDFNDRINNDVITNKVIDKLDTTLNDEQNNVYNSIISDSSNEFLLKGITGSGKTEVYIKLAKYYTDLGKNVIILVPEIGLTPQMVNRFTSNFENISIMHSKLSASEKLEEWKKVKEHKVNVIIGPRSAIFMPISNIGLIIIDEEHEMTYKSEQTPKYKTVDVARFRRDYNNAKLILASATPSVESYELVKENKIKLYELNERYNKKPLPPITVIDMKEELDKGNKSIFSMKLARAIEDRLSKGEQTILFLNRRGFSTFVSCRKCGYVMKCDHCSVPYVYHQYDNSLECHYCASKVPNVSICPNCGSKYIRHFGTGTERVFDEVQKIFPSARILRMDGDTTKQKNSQEQMLKDFKDGKYDILVGTQMIAKGHNFPNVTLVGIVAADIMLNFQDFRAPERTFQLIMQVAGRAGRAEKEGEVLMQTYEPDNYAIENAAIYDYENFFNKEIMLRKLMNEPPYSYLFYIQIVSDNEAMAKDEMNVLSTLIKNKYDELLKTDRKYNDILIKEDSCEILGPGKAGIYKQNDTYRYQMILRGDEAFIRPFAKDMIKEYKQYSKNSKNVSIQLNFD
ncbi:MAG: primosomal protein N' [Clostridia bacterium]|nr:primosomal protein N' [Clostridia bacterium]